MKKKEDFCLEGNLGTTLRFATDEWGWRGQQEMTPGLGERGGLACWNRKHGGRRWLLCYQLSVSAFSCPADLLNKPVSVLIVTRLHVLHSWGLLAEENHHQVKRKEQGAPPTAEYSCTRLQYLNTHAWAMLCVFPSTSWCMFCGIWPGIHYTARKGRPACGINNTLISTPGKASG